MGAWNLQTQTNGKGLLGIKGVWGGGRFLVLSSRNRTILKGIGSYKAVINYPTGGLLFQPQTLNWFFKG